MILKFQCGVYVDDATLNVKMVPVTTLLGTQGLQGYHWEISVLLFTNIKTNRTPEHERGT